MSQTKNQIPMKAFSWLLGKKFIIPSQQRGYKWTPANIEELLKDLWEFIFKPNDKKIYCLQPIAVIEKDDGFSVLDGQQRLTTLFLLYKYLTGECAYSFSYERDMNDDDEEAANRWPFMQKLGTIANTYDVNSCIDMYYIARAYECIKTSFEKNLHQTFQNYIDKEELSTEAVKDAFIKLLNASTDERTIQVIWYSVPENKAYEVFRNLNSGKISLTNSDLIKALLLNRVAGLPASEREDAARQFEEMEQALNKDHFWYMLYPEEPVAPRTRMDLLFNIVTNVSDEDYDKDFRESFRRFSDTRNQSLSSKWKDVRHTFLRLRDFYDNMYCYHYVGFLTYCGHRSQTNFLKGLLSDCRKINKAEFINSLRLRIRKIVNPNESRNVEDFTYDNVSRKDLRQLFLLHNVETLLFHYEMLKSNNELKLQHEYEQFPFELLHKQHWDIEHISSQTLSDFKNEQDRKDWLESVKADFPSYFQYDGDLSQEIRNNNPLARIQFYKGLYEEKANEANFRKLYEEVIRYNDSLEPDSIEEENKNQVGNLVLLDRHTNRSFHNSLFPRKRRIVLIADGVMAEDDEESNVVQLYIPTCTMQCFTKAYSKRSSTKLNAWLQSDANAYTNDLKAKLCDSESSIVKRYFKS